ncbi:hypothetical protein [Rathayibacter sp. AY1A3]|uniref:hypothetical protein n=1 Tax=Rathayibacter sp. AY1A3 TaxID=2080521 RepID=UPI000CE8128B|nr:hypothetical protein [Rathayibacter sp. AY1A3]PPF31227.1 hypothetical protein C5C10_14495 [Rathayibacter sp. AY1A3]
MTTATPETPSAATATPADPNTEPAFPTSPPTSPADIPVDVEPTQAPGVEGDTIAVATSTVTAFCRPSLNYDTWIAELYPFLSQQAAVAYETVDPANVPCTTLTGAATVRDGDGAYTMRILVPTDAGDYSVYVHRTVETGPWAVEQITPLASE